MYTNYGNNSFPMATAVPMPPPPTAVDSGAFTTVNGTTTRRSKHQGDDASPLFSSSSSPSSSFLLEKLVKHTPDPLNEEQMHRLIDQGYTRGLAMSLNQMRQIFALRIWIIDNSGSMQKADGHRIVTPPSNNKNSNHNKKDHMIKMIPCTRWDEITECVNYHIQMAALIQAPTRFRLLNNPGVNVGPQQFSIAENNIYNKINNHRHHTSSFEEVAEATQIIRRTRPGGCTPLTSHVLEIHREVLNMAPALNRMGKKVVIVIATDGLPTDERGYGGPDHNQEFVEALRLLEGLPVWVVVRLCTDEENVVNFYNELDGQLELSLEVLDDFVGEAKEVIGENPWLNYALPLHRLREMGYHDRVFDMLDERPLTKSEIRDFCLLLFGEQHFDGIPDPSLEWEMFLSSIKQLLSQEEPQYDPIKKRVLAWMDTKKLNRVHGKKTRCVIS